MLKAFLKARRITKRRIITRATLARKMATHRGTTFLLKLHICPYVICVLGVNASHTRLKTHRLFQVDIDRREQCCAANHTRKKAQVVTNLQQTCSNAVPTTCQQDVFALLVPSLLTSCQRLVGNLLQGC